MFYIYNLIKVKRAKKIFPDSFFVKYHFTLRSFLNDTC